ncbi:MAG TPA: deoxynucleoside kinase [Bacteroidales bacterium]|jgi:deoxyadenosine/deoxycytidine kinase|nr:deoxynucleoside kinase [Bacteroidales bacterium]HNW20430.1 deoxynucleoside kinase [Bacteroidales bacterium]HRR53483.1 deoxynucleoside kinase [Bacteroidales bacterium]HRS70162.1 deoxynucleoside kinase [Bacteroidales bacterium]
MKYICIEGCIGVGKTSLACMLAKDWNAQLILEQFEENVFLPKFYKEPDRYALALELSFLAMRYKQLKIEVRENIFYDIKVADFIFDKTFIFANETLKDTNEYKLFTNIYDIMSNQIAKPDLIIFLYASADQLLNNINKRGRSYEKSITADYLENIQNSYLQFFSAHPGLPILYLDINGIDFINNEQDYLDIKEKINLFI